MSNEDITPEQDPAQELREITVKVPAHRVAQFERFYQRFLAWPHTGTSQVGNEDCAVAAPGRRGRPAPRSSLRSPRRDRRTRAAA